MMRSLAAIMMLIFIAAGAHAQKQKIDSIAFHLYTDSLKKGGVYNYINVDAKLSNGRWMPLSSQELIFSTSGGKFDGCNLYFDSSFKADSVVVKAVLKADTSLQRSVTIYIKKLPETEELKSMEDVMGPNTRQPARKKKRG